MAGFVPLSEEELADEEMDQRSGLSTTNAVFGCLLAEVRAGRALREAAERFRCERDELSRKNLLMIDAINLCSGSCHSVFKEEVK